MSITITIDDTPELRDAIAVGIKDLKQHLGDKTPGTAEEYLEYEVGRQVLTPLLRSVFTRQVDKAAKLARRSPEAYQKFKEVLDSFES